jgi:hypothetical protein
MCRTDKYPASITIWGLTDPVDAAFLWENGYTYFFRLENNIVCSQHIPNPKIVYIKIFAVKIFPPDSKIADSKFYIYKKSFSGKSF